MTEVEKVEKVEKEKVANPEPHIYPSTTPLDLCISGDIRELSKNEQKAVLGMLADELENEYRSARSVEELQPIQKHLEVIKPYYGLMDKRTQKDVEKLTEYIKKVIARYQK